MKAGIVCDDYKTAFFKAALDIGGYTYTEHAGVTATTKLLRVVIEPHEATKLAALCKRLERTQPWFKGAGKG